MGDVTVLLNRTCQGDRQAQDELFELIYSELKVMAASQRRDFTCITTLQTGELVSELWLKLKLAADRSFKSRRHFFALATKAMRNLLVDMARAKDAEKRGKGWQPVSLSLHEPASDTIDVGAIALHELLLKLEKLSPLQAQVLELRFFGGRSRREVEELLELTPSQARSEEAHALTWLRIKLGGG